MSSPKLVAKKALHLAVAMGMSQVCVELARISAITARLAEKVMMMCSLNKDIAMGCISPDGCIPEWKSEALVFRHSAMCPLSDYSEFPTRCESSDYGIDHYGIKYCTVHDSDLVDGSCPMGGKL